MNKAQRVVVLVTAAVTAVLLCYAAVLHMASPFRPEYIGTDHNGHETVMTAVAVAMCVERGVWLLVVTAVVLGGALVAVLHRRKP